MLIVDDEAGVLNSLVRLLKRDGYQIFTASCRDEALDVLNNHTVDVILSDQCMPGYDGTELLNEVRHAYPESVRLILSGQSDPNDIAKAMDEGDIYKFMTKPWDEVLLRANIREAFSKSKAVRENAKQLDYLQNHDTLTGLPNRKLFDTQLKHVLINSSSTDSVALALISINPDVHEFALGGDAWGQRVRQIAEYLQTGWGGLDEVGRLSETEFAVARVLENKDQDLKMFAERITRLNQVFGGSDLLLAGICVTEVSAADQVQLLTAARLALKRMPINNDTPYNIVTIDVAEAVQRERQLLTALRQAISEQQLELLYQPQVDLESGEVHAVEALIRWHHPDYGTVAPAEFIPLAERSGLICDLGRWALDEVCRQLTEWHNKGFTNVSSSVNVSPYQLNDDRFVDDVKHVLATAPGGSLELEITETQSLLGVDRFCKQLYMLADIGVGLAIDDFGAGTTSMSYLTALPFTKIKLDRCLMAETHGDRIVTIAAKIIELGKELGLTTVAEGVETHEHVALLQSLGCEKAQGYFFSQPVAAVQLEAYLCGGFNLQKC